MSGMGFEDAGISEKKRISKNQKWTAKTHHMFSKLKVERVAGGTSETASTKPRAEYVEKRFEDLG